jgi:hypothetical protein
MLHKEQKKLIPFYLFIMLLVLVSVNNSFFWDKDILNSRQAFWYLENGFGILFPANIDSGHPPIMALLLAGLWKVFGINLWIGHLAMLPFALGLVWQFYRFLRYFFHANTILAALLLVIIDTSILTQVIILTGDLLILFFFFLSINSVLYNKRQLLLFVLIGLGLSSSRGIISCSIIGLFDIYLLIEKEGWKKLIPKTISIIPYYIPALFAIIGYLLYHYIHMGWIGYDPVSSNWAGCFEPVNFKGFFRNIFVLAWRLADFGRLFLWMVAGYFLILTIRKKFQGDRNIKMLLALFIISLFVYAPTMLIYKALASHRYLLPVYVVFATLVAYLILEKLTNDKLRKSLYIVLILGLLSGNFWVYPDSIAKGWDASLAHIPYYKLRKEMIRYIDEQEIPFNKVGSEVPNVTQLKFVDLSTDERFFPKKDFRIHEYIFYSNVYNMFTDEELKELKEKWIPVNEFRMLQVRVTLYKRPYYKEN